MIPGCQTIRIRTDAGLPRDAAAPLIVSASRATDIPAFYARWFVERLRRGYARRVNPFNRQSQYISFQNARAVVFWTKNPRPMFPFLSAIEQRGLGYYFQFTLNDYEREGLEPGLPPLAERIAAFQELATRLGPERVVWRWDPLLLTERLDLDALLERLSRVAEQLRGYTQRLVISFIDIAAYAKVRRNLARANAACREFTPDLMLETARRLERLNREWRLDMAACAEDIDLTAYGIERGRCIDDRLLRRLFPQDRPLTEFLAAGARSPRGLKDRGQRPGCGCIVSKDIGMYNTCPHLCAYCYANTSPAAVARNRSWHDEHGAALA